MTFAVGVDLGGTQLRVALVDREGRIHVHRSVSTASASGPAAVITQIESLVHEVTAGVDSAEMVGVGIGSPGPLDPFTGVVLDAANLRGWVDVPLRDILRDRLALPVELNNDGNVATLGEWRFGSGRHCRDFICITVGTGIGGGVISGGRLLLGRMGMAGEVGHMIVAEDGPRCECGNNGRCQYVPARDRLFPCCRSDGAAVAGLT